MVNGDRSTDNSRTGSSSDDRGVCAASCWYLTGPTASGKTGIGLELADQLNAEIISLDSMAIYRGMDIGTAKPTAQQRARCTHHLIDVLDCNQEFTLADYVAAADQCIQQIRARRKEVLFVGGTPLYLKALLRGIFSGPGPDEDFRREVLEETRRVGVEALHARLQQVDPLSAARLHPQDLRRIIRALEVHKLTGRPISHFQMQFDQGLPAERCRVFVLDWARDELHHRIDDRVDRMFEKGLVDEVQRLLDQFGMLSKTAIQAVGYREVLQYLDGKWTIDQTIEHTKTRTRQFAKRQLTWFRSLSECRWLPMEVGRPARDVARQILAGV
jgi:tRNA dimethylallyltransferase